MPKTYRNVSSRKAFNLIVRDDLPFIIDVIYNCYYNYRYNEDGEHNSEHYKEIIVKALPEMSSCDFKYLAFKDGSIAAINVNITILTCDGFLGFEITTMINLFMPVIKATYQMFGHSEVIQLGATNISMLFNPRDVFP